MLKVKDLIEFSGEERYALEWNHLTRAMYAANLLKKEYDEYLICEKDCKVEIENYSLLSTLVLSKLGYPMDSFGTYLYVEEIVEIVKRLNEQKGSNTREAFYQIKGEFENHYSNFYREIIKEKLDMRSKDFHNYVQEAIYNIDCEKRREKFSNDLYKNVTESLSPFENAFVIANYISVNSKRVKARKYKVKQ